MKKLTASLTYANVVSTLCLFLLLGGGAAFAATQLPKNSVGAKQIRKGAVTQAKISKEAQAALRGQTGEPGQRGATGALGETGPRGPVGPTEGQSLGEDMIGAPELSFSKTVTTATSGKLYAFAHFDQAEVSCSAPGPVEVALFVNGVLVPGTTWGMGSEIFKSIDFAGVTTASVPAGVQKLEWGAQCLGASVVQGMLPGLYGFGAVVLG
jgi:hypothetical protein